ncbi:hypothetical protein BH24ACT21_BH24ACT21_16050 [soil metagenome]
MGKFSIRAAKFLALALIALLSTTACSGDDTTERERTREFVEGTLSSPELAETTEAATTTGGTTGSTVGRREPDVVLRLEGDPKTTFSGICTAGTEESVIGGKVPKRYRFDLNSQSLSCRIQKRDPGNGSLRVVLLSGDSTRSVQQTESQDSIIRLSYEGE